MLFCHNQRTNNPNRRQQDVCGLRAYHTLGHAQETGRPLGELLQESEELAEYWAQITERQREIILDPAQYTGIAARKTRLLCDMWEERLGL
ncbi:MAG TPA: hypothetical protein DEP45_08365 [Armatimonadetes bacterium]|nr:hypothetical protein [Armatimonadota bacterium]